MNKRAGTKHAFALSFAMGVVALAIVVSCAPKHPNLVDADPFERSSADTPEEMIHEFDMMRIEEFDELNREMDQRLMALEAEDPSFEGLDPPVDEEPGAFKRKLRKAGMVTYVIFSVAFALGMKALPFLI